MGEEQKRKSGGWAVVVFLLLLLGYVGGYFGLGEHTTGVVTDYSVYSAGVTSTSHHRSFPYAPLVTIYYPMGWIECRMRNEWVALGGPTDGVFATHRFYPLP